MSVTVWLGNQCQGGSRGWNDWEMALRGAGTVASPFGSVAALDVCWPWAAPLLCVWQRGLCARGQEELSSSGTPGFISGCLLFSLFAFPCLSRCVNTGGFVTKQLWLRHPGGLACCPPARLGLKVGAFRWLWSLPYGWTENGSGL